ncbi:hypothetical protein Tsubulata_014641 [Turnera subulata]|uniref:Uncharacterized protein n=1 Tax=Turnera subulata TaxID=218843 RepID=A0A9Q0JLX0_9ROSI|nr:hypothetical protein Tsubulata_014641 [Turnera subulata]
MRSSIAESFQKRNLFPNSNSLPVSQSSNDHEAGQGQGQGLRRRLSSLSLREAVQQGQHRMMSAFHFPRSKSMGDCTSVSSSVREWWDWGWGWILSRKPVFAQDLEMNEEEAEALGSHSRGSWRHLLFKLRSEIRKLSRSSHKVGLPQTYKYDSFNYSKNFDHGASVHRG